MGSLCFNIEEKSDEKNACKKKEKFAKTKKNFPKALIFSFDCAHVAKVPTAFSFFSQTSHLILSIL